MAFVLVDKRILQTDFIFKNSQQERRITIVNGNNNTAMATIRIKPHGKHFLMPTK